MAEILAHLIAWLWPWRKVPDLVGLSNSRAVDLLNVNKLDFSGIDPTAPGWIAKQEPAPGSWSRRGATVTLLSRENPGPA